MGIDNFNDLVVSNALVRPGALLSQGQKYIDCKKGYVSPHYPDESVREILSETFGTVIFQEQLMLMSVKLSGFTWAEADKLRKIIGKKRDANEFDLYKDKFVNNSIISKNEAKKMWAEFEMSALYMFNKSHAVAYSMLSYQTMWLKVNYPLEFIWSLLFNENSTEKITAYLMEAQRLGVPILPPDVNISEEYFITDNSTGVDCIRFGLANVLSCGKSAIKEIMTKRPFTCFDEFNNKCTKSAVKAPLRENLDKVGAFESMGHVSQYDHKRYYLPILGFSIKDEDKNEMDEFVGQLADFHEINSPLTLVKAVVRSTKKTPQYLRIEFEDHSGSATVFADRNTEIATRDHLYALIGDRTMHSFCDVYNFVGTGLHDVINLWRKGKDHEYSWLYETGLGSASDEKTLMYIMHSRVFITSKGKTMANVYCWDGQNVFKVVIFPRPYVKLKNVLKQGKWFAAKLSKIEEKQTITRIDSYKVESDSSIIAIENYIERKNLVKNIV
jgi:DNA polymerase-3 subunit alpha